jgi:hypothetical protein
MLAHKNTDEPAGVLPLRQISGSSYVKCYGRCNTALTRVASHETQRMFILPSKKNSPPNLDTRVINNLGQHCCIQSLISVTRHSNRRDIEHRCTNYSVHFQRKGDDDRRAAENGDPNLRVKGWLSSWHRG